MSEPDYKLLVEAVREAFTQTREGIDYDKAESMAQNCDYAFMATHTDENPINWPDATAFYLEGYERALDDFKANVRRITEAPKDGGE